MEKRRVAELLVVFGFFLAIGWSWLGIMPLWQGADEPAHFAYAQYMATHVLPPVQRVVAPGAQPWTFSPSPAEAVAIQVTHYSRLLAGPKGQLSTTPREAAQARRAVRRASAAPGGDQAGSQNYVAIYPPLYYAAIGRLASWLHIRDVFTQAFVARAVSAALLGLTGVLVDLVVGLAIAGRRLRTALAASLGLLFPTLGMLGGTVTNDLTADAASLAVFYLAARSLSAPSFRRAAALVFGAAAGLALWTKEEAYVGLAVAVPFVLWAVWRREGPRRAWPLIAAAVAVGAAVGGPWLWFTWHAYHALVPPLTYQAVGPHPRTVAWVLHQQLLNRTYLRYLLVGQTVFGIVWWSPWAHATPGLNLIALPLAALLVGGLVTARKAPGFWLAVTWMAVGAAVLGWLQIQYSLATGASFLQGRYLFFLLGPYFWLAAHAIRRVAVVAVPMLLAGAAVLSALVANATLYRFYDAGLGAYFTGRIVPLGPPAILLVSRLAAAAVPLGVIGLLAALMIPYAQRITWPAPRGPKAG